MATNTPQLPVAPAAVTAAAMTGGMRAAVSPQDDPTTPSAATCSDAGVRARIAGTMPAVRSSSHAVQATPKTSQLSVAATATAVTAAPAKPATR